LSTSSGSGYKAAALVRKMMKPKSKIRWPERARVPDAAAPLQGRAGDARPRVLLLIVALVALVVVVTCVGSASLRGDGGAGDSRKGSPPGTPTEGPAPFASNASPAPSASSAGRLRAMNDSGRLSPPHCFWATKCTNSDASLRLSSATTATPSSGGEMRIG
jgi:hypothetical protein